MSAALVGRLRVVAWYLELRANMPSRYERSALDDLLTALDRSSGRRVAIADVDVGVRRAERAARVLRMRPDTCLFRALTRYAALRRAGHAPRFVMAMDDDDPDNGHAWVELDDAPFLEPRLPALRRTFEHPRRA